MVPMSSDKARHEQLARILRSESFQQADRLKRFLTFVVTEAIAGRQAELKEYVIGVQVFRKEESFDPRTDPIVRVQARRLRAKLVRYYREEGSTDDLIIDLPKGGYAPVFRMRDALSSFPRQVTAAGVSRNAVIVDRFADRSGTGELGTWAEGLRDEVIHRLAQLSGLRVLAAHGGNLDDEGEMTAAAVIGGTVRVAGSQLRVTVHLVDAVTRSYVWSESIDVERAEAFAAQERVAELVIARLGPEWRAAKRVGGAASVNPAAESLYAQGRYHLNQRTEEGLRKSVEFFEKALAEGAEFAPAHSGLADAFGLLAHYGVLSPSEAWSKAASHAATAVALDDRCAEAHTSLAHVKATQDFDWKGAEQEFRRAIALEPGYATARHWYAASCLAPQGRLDEALDEMVAAHVLDPVSSIVARDLAMIHFYRRDFEMALECCDHAIELNPHFAPTYWLLGLIQEQRGEFDESVAAHQRAVHLSPNAPRLHGALGRALALVGRKKLALEVLKGLEASARKRYVSPLEFAWIYFALGRGDMGYRWLAKAVGDRAFDLVAIRVDPRFDRFRSDPRFKRMLNELGVD
jgi:TolB-like protein/Flp pilus assembly protein TadD